MSTYIRTLEERMRAQIDAIDAVTSKQSSKLEELGGLVGKKARQRIFLRRQKLARRVAGRAFRVVREIQLTQVGMSWLC